MNASASANDPHLTVLSFSLCVTGVRVLRIVVCYPLDMVRTRLAVDIGSASEHEFTGAWHCFTSLSRIDGIPALYAGLNVCLMFLLQHASRSGIRMYCRLAIPSFIHTCKHVFVQAHD